MSWKKPPITKFKTPSADLAYWIGYLFADGSVYHSKVGNPLITLYSNDYEIMKNYVNFLELPKTRIKRVNRYKNIEYYVKFRSQEIASILEKYGIVPNKTYSKFKYKFIPKFYLEHYLRGLFEADGYYGVYPKPKLSFEVRLTNNDEAFLKAIKSKIRKEYNINAEVYIPKNSKDYNTKALRIPTKQQCSFLKRLYANKPKYKLKRKQSLANLIISIRESFGD